MKVFDTLNEENFELFAAKHYDNPHCVGVEEFYDDLNRFRYVKRLLGRYEASDDLQERLILNHLIVLFNLFGVEAAKKMLLYKIEDRHLSAIKPFLVFLHYLGDNELIEVPLDPTVVDRLRKI